VGHPGRFRNLAIVNSAAMNMGVQVQTHLFNFVRFLCFCGLFQKILAHSNVPKQLPYAFF
jgi:hypothetical protein